MRRFLLWSVLATMILVGAWMLHRVAGADSRAEERSRSETPSPAAAPVSPAGAPAEVVLRREAEAADRDGSTSRISTVLVRVQRKSDGAPVPHAEVLLLAFDETVRAASSTLVADGEDVERMLEELGTIHRCDEEGTVALPVPSAPFWLGARDGSLFGLQQSFDPRSLPAEITLAIEPAIHLRVHVEDESGAPLAGVKVAFLSGDGNRMNEHCPTRTDERGDATLHHIEVALTPETRRWRARVAAMLPVDPLPGADVSLEDPPLDPIRIVLPRGGSVAVEVLDFFGAPRRDGWPVTLQRALSVAEREEWRERHGLEPSISYRTWLGAATERTSGGVAHFPYVPLGCRFEVHTITETFFAQVAQEADGPLRPGEVVRIVLRQPMAQPELTGRLVAPDGIPIGKEELQGTFRRGWPRRAGTIEGTVLLPLDADGRFRMILAEAEVPPGTARILSIWRALDGESRIQVAWIFVPERVPVEGYDCGDVILGESVAVAGTVRYVGGTPVPGARLALIGRIAPPDEMVPDSPYPISDFLWRTKDDGSFRLESILPGDNHFLSVQPELGGSQLIAFSPGQTDLLVELEARGWITGRLILDDRIPADLFRIQFTHASGSTSQSNKTLITPSGEFRSSELDTGLWSLSVRASGGPELARVDGIEVRALQATEDPRTQLDLRGRLHRHRLTVLDPDGGRPQILRFYLEEQSGWRPWNAENPAELLSIAAILHGYAGADGWGQVEFLSTGEPLELALPRGIRGRVRLTGDGLEHLKGGVSLSVGGRSTSTGRPLLWQRSWWLRESFVGECTFPDAGTYAARIGVLSEQSELPGLGPTPLLFDGAQEYLFTISTADQEVEIQIELSEQQVRAALDRREE